MKKKIYSSDKVLRDSASFDVWNPRMNSETKYLVITKD